MELDVCNNKLLTSYHIVSFQWWSLMYCGHSFNVNCPYSISVVQATMTRPAPLQAAIAQQSETVCRWWHHFRDTINKQHSFWHCKLWQFSQFCLCRGGHSPSARILFDVNLLFVNCKKWLVLVSALWHYYQLWEWHFSRLRITFRSGTEQMVNVSYQVDLAETYHSYRLPPVLLQCWTADWR